MTNQKAKIPDDEKVSNTNSISKLPKELRTIPNKKSWIPAFGSVAKLE